MRNLVIATITTLLATTFAHSSNLSYELKIINKDKTVHCDLLYIIGDDLRCRQGRGTILYSYSSAEKIAVESNGKVFTFEKELSTEKEQLATAFKNISDKEYKRLRGIYEKKRKYLAKKRQEELERQQALASQSPTYPGQPRQSSNYQQPRRDPRCNEIARQLSDISRKVSSASLGEMVTLGAQKNSLTNEYELLCMSGAERQSRVQARQGKRTNRKLNQIQQKQNEIQNRQRGIGY